MRIDHLDVEPGKEGDQGGGVDQVAALQTVEAEWQCRQPPVELAEARFPENAEG